MSSVFSKNDFKEGEGDGGLVGDTKGHTGCCHTVLGKRTLDTHYFIDKLPSVEDWTTGTVWIYYYF